MVEISSYTIFMPETDIADMTKTIPIMPI